MLKDFRLSAALLAIGLGLASGAQAEVPKIGLSGPMTGAAAAWGIGFDWVAKQAAEKVLLPKVQIAAHSSNHLGFGGRTALVQCVGLDSLIEQVVRVQLGTVARQPYQSQTTWQPRHRASCSATTPASITRPDDERLRPTQDARVI